MANSTADVWQKILELLREELPERTVTNWFESASPEVRDSDPTTLVLTVPSSYHRDHIRDRYYRVLQSVSQKEFAEEVRVRFRVDEKCGGEDEATASRSPNPASRGSSMEESRRENGLTRTFETPDSSGAQSPDASRSSSASATVTREAVSSRSSNRPRSRTSSKSPSEFHRSRLRDELKDRYTFENFVEGDSNALAKNASTAVANNPGETNFNPFLIYGGVGLGKTHLAQAIARYSISHKTAKYICYATSEEFTNEFVQAIREGDGSKFSNRYRGIDLLILDDIQFFQGKEKTQEEFFHLFNSLYQQNKQIVLCADRPPQEIDGLEERLLSRFEWGLSADIQKPTLETRLAILQLKARSLDLEIEQEVLNLMAESITTNIRQLEGALKQLSARANLLGVKVDTDTARHLLKDQLQLPESTPITSEDIFHAVTSYYSISHEELVGRSRRKEVVYPRHVAMYFCRNLTSLPLSSIGHRFGGRDHSTVSHACEKVSDRLDVQPQMKRELDEVKREIRNQAAR